MTGPRLKPSFFEAMLGLQAQQQTPPPPQRQPTDGLFQSLAELNAAIRHALVPQLLSQVETGAKKFGEQQGYQFEAQRAQAGYAKSHPQSLRAQQEMMNNAVMLALGMVKPAEVSISPLSVTGYSKGQSTGFIRANDPAGKWVGHLDFDEYEGVPRIKWIEVDEKYRRKGVGSALVRALEKEYPGARVQWTRTTESGAELKKALATRPPVSRADRILVRSEGRPAVMDDAGQTWSRKQHAEHGDLVSYAEAAGATFTRPDPEVRGWILDNNFVSLADLQPELVEGTHYTQRPTIPQPRK